MADEPILFDLVEINSRISGFDLMSFRARRARRRALDALMQMAEFETVGRLNAPALLDKLVCGRSVSRGRHG